MTYLDLELREALADLAHRQWSGWMVHLFSKCTTNEDGTATIPIWAVENWNRQINTDYNALLEEEKDADRDEADRVLELLERELQSSEGVIK